MDVFKKHFLSLIIIIFYILCIKAMTNFQLRGLIESLIFTLPIILFVIFWCSATLQNYHFIIKNYSPSKEFNEDLLLIFYAMFLTGMILLILDKDNPDLISWWDYILLFQSVIFFIFSFSFSSLLQLKPKHKHYTQIWFFIILITQPLLYFFPYKINIPLLGAIDRGYILMFLYLIINLFCIGMQKNFSRQ